MAQYTMQEIVQAGVVCTALAAVSASDTFADDGSQSTFLEVNNGSGSPVNVTTVYPPGAERIPGFGLDTLADPVVAVAAGARVKIGPFPPRFIDPATGLVTVTYSATTTVTAGVFHTRKADAY